MKIIHYCQHVLGIGHFLRSLEICKALHGHEILLVTGGAGLDIQVPDHVRGVRLPGLMMDPDFKGLLAAEEGRSIDQIKEARRERLFDIFKKEAPDIFIVELYPFGRKAFRFELNPIIHGIRNGDLPASQIICSLRDILVEKGDQSSYEERVVTVLNRYFDAVLVHADPSLIRLNETFSRIGDIGIPIIYTGFIAPKPARNGRARIRQLLDLGENEVLVVASAGGGKVGYRLLEAVAQTYSYLKTETGLHFCVFTGPYMEERDFKRLNSLSNRRIQIARFTPDFLSYMAGADLSVSMAGYNTCMNILTSQVPALVLPFSQNREQRLRAEALGRLGVLEILAEDDLQPPRLASMMEALLCRRSQSRITIDLDGAKNTARWLESCMKNPKQD